MRSGPPGVTVNVVQLITSDIRQSDELMKINRVGFFSLRFKGNRRMPISAIESHMFVYSNTYHFDHESARNLIP